MVTQPKAASSCRRASKPAGAAWRSQRLPPLSSVHVWKHLSLPTPFMSGCAPIAAPRPLELLCQLPISNAPGTQRIKPPLSATQGVRNVGSNCAGPTAPSSAYSSGSHCDASCASAGVLGDRRRGSERRDGREGEQAASHPSKVLLTRRVRHILRICPR